MTGDRSNAAAILEQALRLQNAKDHVAAFRLYQQVNQLDPNNVTALMGMGKILAVNGQIDDAIRMFDHIVMLAPNELAPRSALVSYLYRRQRFLDVLKHIDILIEMDPTNSHWYSVPANIYYSLGNPDKVRHYIALGSKNAARGIDYQPGDRHALPKDLQKALDGAMAKRARAFVRDRVRKKPAVAAWSAVADDDGRVRLRGASNGLTGAWKVSFEISPNDDKKRTKVVAAAEPGGKAAAGVRQWSASVDGLVPGKSYACRITATQGAKAVASGETCFTMPLKTPPIADTGDATPIGGEGVTVNGRAGGSNLPTRYWFAWGDQPGKLMRKTPVRLLPPGRSLRAREVPYRNLQRWLVYALETSIERAPGTRADDVAADHVYRLVSPFGKDRNHLSGIGVGELVGGLDSAAQPQTDLARRHAGDALDFRDAEIEVIVDFKELDAKDFLLSFWMHTYTGDRTVDYDTFDAAPWALTGQLVDPAAPSGNGQRRLRFTLPCRSDAWTFCGNNVAEQGERAGRYTYYPLHETLADHRGNVVLMFLFGNERELPEGAFDIHAAEVRCRNGSLLASGTPARLMEWPASSFVDPGALTGGWIGNEDHYWFSGEKPMKPQEFVWDFGHETRLEYLRLHQNPLAPAKRVEVWGGKGKTFRRLWKTDMAARVPSGVVGDPIASIVLSPAVPVRFLKLRIVSGHGDDCWGLDAFEAFGDGAEPRPELEPCTVCDDLAGLAPGKTIHYRLAAENAAGRSEGDIRSFTVPVDAKPIIHGAEVFRHDPKNKKTIVVTRMTAMGLPTTLKATAKDDDGEDLDCPPRDAGSERTPRHIACIVAGARPGAHCRLTLTADNEAGVSAPVTVEWTVPK